VLVKQTVHAMVWFRHAFYSAGTFRVRALTVSVMVVMRSMMQSGPTRLGW